MKTNITVAVTVKTPDTLEADGYRKLTVTQELIVSDGKVLIGKDTIVKLTAALGLKYEIV